MRLTLIALAVVAFGWLVSEAVGGSVKNAKERDATLGRALLAGVAFLLFGMLARGVQ